MNKNYKLTLITTTIIILDLITKYFTYLKKPKINLFLFDINFITNTGASFGMLKNRNLFLILIGVIIIFTILYNIKEFTKTNLELWAIALILSGAIGNIANRIILGYVIDFIDLRFWPVFNIADIAITSGIIFIIINYLKKKK